MLKLVLPSDNYKKTFLEAAEEYKKDRERGLYPATLNMEKMTENEFDGYVKRRLDQSKGINIKEGRVPATEYWLVDGNEFIGKISIRHYLNENLRKMGGHIGYTIRPSRRKLGYGTKMLSLALLEAKKLGIRKALITCDKTNIGSVKMIEKNGGILENEEAQDDGRPPRLRYWIEIK